jgi:hypothetical protein
VRVIRVVRAPSIGLCAGLAAIVLAALGLGAARTAAAAPAYAKAAVAGSAVLLRVSCTSPEACIAVGTGPSDTALAEKWDGKTWTIVPTARPRGASDSNFYAVSCISSHACMAVGGYDSNSHPHGQLPLAEVWNGRVWSVKATPQPTSDSALGGVSCRSASRCVAVGNALTQSANNAFSEAWNGRGWTIKRIPRPAGTTYSTLDAVSCASASLCMAVGDYQVNGSADSLTFAEAWNGKRWARKTSPNPVTGANGSQLNGVSCRSTSFCVAVGGYTNTSNSGGLGLIEAWNGRTWAVAESANDPTSAVTALQDVSCPSTNACTAVGSETPSSLIGSTLTERWSGGRWTSVPTPNPGGATQSALAGVACGSPGACVAVGSYFTNSGPGGFPLPMTEVFNGATWTIATTPF